MEVAVSSQCCWKLWTNMANAAAIAVVVPSLSLQNVTAEITVVEFFKLVCHFVCLFFNQDGSLI